MHVDEEQALQRQDAKASTSASDYPTFPHAQTMAAFPEARHDWLQWDDLLSEQEKATKYKVRTFAVSPGAPHLCGERWCSTPAHSRVIIYCACCQADVLLLILLQEQEVAPVIADYWERAAFPHQLVPKLAKLGVAGATLEGWVLFALCTLQCICT